jgi:hypothetical protein
VHIDEEARKPKRETKWKFNVTARVEDAENNTRHHCECFPRDKRALSNSVTITAVGNDHVLLITFIELPV